MVQNQHERMHDLLSAIRECVRAWAMHLTLHTCIYAYFGWFVYYTGKTRQAVKIHVPGRGSPASVFVTAAVEPAGYLMSKRGSWT